MNTTRVARLHILVVDDDTLLRSAIVSVLRKAYAVSDVASVASGRAILGRTPIDVLVTDFDLGTDETGLTLLREVRRTSPSTRRILMTGGLPAHVALEDGLCEIVLSKPFRARALLRQIARPS